MSTAITKVGSGFTLAPQSWNELLQFAELAAKSDLVPKDYRGKPANIVLAVQWGGELGVAPLQALQGIAVINGRPSVWGDLMIAICMKHPDYEDTVESWDEKTGTATCTAKRRGRSDKTHTFGPDDVKKASLGATHNSYPKRMRQMRARGFALRDQWSDALKGMISAEEAQDYPKPEVRAEVTSSKPIEEPSQPTAAEPKKESKPVGPVFWLGWPDKAWAGKLLTEAPANVLGDYIAYLDALIQDPTRERLHKGATTSRDAAQKRFDELLDAETERAMAKADEAAKAPADAIIDGLQAEHDRTHGAPGAPAEDTNSQWGLESPQ